MAEVRRVGAAVNSTEEWAAEFLAVALPDHYRVYTNFQLVADGQPYEVDLAVLSDYAIHLVDVKGFVGEVSYDQREFIVDGRPMAANALGKISYLARSLRREWERASSLSCPWLQGSVFVTGKEGTALDLQHPAGQALDVHGPDSVVDYLTTARKPDERNRITESVAQAFERLLNMPERSGTESLQDFRLIPDTVRSVNSFIRIQEATHQMMSLPITYQLFMVDRDRTESVEPFNRAVRMLRDRYKAMLSLRGIPGIPRSLPPFYAKDGRWFVLPVEKAAGRSLARVCQDESIALDKRIALFLSVARTVNEAHQRDVFSATLDAAKVIVTDTLEPVVHGWVPEAESEAAENAADRDVTALAKMGLACFTEKVWQGEVVRACPELADWCEEVLVGTYLPIEKLFESLQSTQPVRSNEEQAAFEIAAGSVINGRYALQHRLGEGASGEVWAARHQLGDFECCAKIITIPYGAEALARHEFEVLANLFHPNIVRLFSFEKIAGSDLFCLVMGMGEMTLRELIDDAEQSFRTALKWFEGLLSALQYLRSLPRPVVHGDIKPRNIVITDNHASIIDFNLADHFSGTLRYLCPRVDGAHAADTNDDLYSLCLSFYELLVGYPDFESGQPEFMKWAGPCPEGFPPRVFDRILSVLAGDFPASDDSLKEWFCIGGFVPTHEQPLPKGFAQRWDIRSDERFIISTLLQNGGQLTKNQLVSKSAKWAFGHVGAKDKSRINPRLSTLRDEKGLIDYPRGRQATGKRILVSISNADLLRAWIKICG